MLSSVVVGTDGNGAFLVDGVTHEVRRLPAGLAGDRPTAIAVHRGMICAGASRRGGFAAARTAITCFDESLQSRAVYEDRRGQGLPGSDIRRVLITDRVIWAATDAGLARAVRGRNEVEVVTTREGLPANEVFALARSASGVWAGTSHGVVHVVDSGRSVAASRAGASPPVLSLATTGDTLLVGTMAGLATLVPLEEAPRADPGPGPAREPVLGLATLAGHAVAVTARRVLLRGGGAWQAVEPARNLGELAAVAADSTGFWIAGSLGFAWFDPDENRWLPMLQDDVLVPVRDIAASRGYVWVVTDAGVVRFEKRLLLP
jgi:ligand-binding sensor domain-containing protein